MRSLCYYLLSNWDLPRMSEVKIQHFQYLITSNEQLPALEGQIPWPWSLWQHRKYPLDGKANTSKRCFPWTSAHSIASTQMFHLQGLGGGKPGSITPCLLIGRFLKVSCPVAIKVKPWNRVKPLFPCDSPALGPFMLDIWVKLGQPPHKLQSKCHPY